jgi:hypothetical protein
MSDFGLKAKFGFRPIAGFADVRFLAAIAVFTGRIVDQEFPFVPFGVTGTERAYSPSLFERHEYSTPSYRILSVGCARIRHGPDDPIHW